MNPHCLHRYRSLTEDISIGSDPHQASLVIVDPSIEGVHARIHHEDKSFLHHRCGNRRRHLGELRTGNSTGHVLASIWISSTWEGLVSVFSFPSQVQLRKMMVTPLEPQQ